MFIVPMNDAAESVKRVMQASPWGGSNLTQIAFGDPGDTLIVDNWRCLHGRSDVPDEAMDRHLERVYLSEIHA
jgi:hypothetical protein